MQNISSVRLADIVQFIPGAALSSEEGEPVPVVQAREVGAPLPPRGELRQSGIAPGKRRDMAKLRTGDILVVSKGTAPRVSLVGAETEGAVASANLIVLRPDQAQVIPSALHAYLETEAGQQRLVAAQTGSVMPSLSTAALGKVTVPVLPCAMQASVGAFASAAAELLAAQERTLTLKRELLARITEAVFSSGDLSPFAAAELA